MKSRLFPIVLLVLFLLSCKKDCLVSGKCEPSSYQSAYLMEQTRPAATGTVYYVDPDEGKDDQSGTSESEAWESLEKVSNSSFQPGDQVLFKRGAYHFGELEIESSGTDAERILFGAYGTGDLPLLRTTKNDQNAILIREADYVTLQNLNVQGGHLAIRVEGSDWARILGCRIGEGSNSGLRATGDKSSRTGANYGKVSACLIYSGRSGDLGDLQGTDGIQLLDGASNWLVENSEFKAWAHSAALVKQIFTTNESANNFFRHNYFNCGDIDYMRAFDFTGGEDRVYGNVFMYNLIEDQSVTSHLHGHDNLVAYNLFRNVRKTDASDQPWAVDFHVFTNGQSGAVDKDQLVCHDNEFLNNMVLGCAGPAIVILDGKNSAQFQVESNSIRNNVIIDAETFVWMETEPSTISLSHNLFFNQDGSGQFQYGAQTGDLSFFEGFSGNSKGHYLSSNLMEDPQVNDLAGGDYYPVAGSPLIDAGYGHTIGEDYYGNPVGLLVSIGLVDVD